MSSHTKHATAPSAIEVAVFDAGELISTRRCRGVSEARRFMNHLGREGFDCLIVSPRLRQSLLSTESASARA